ncbi:hypothetical protein MMC10_006687 [Thelotrema lepadinum]|nr:hypothetical protein [Thelotrema lepadinum]
MATPSDLPPPYDPSPLPPLTSPTSSPRLSIPTYIRLPLATLSALTLGVLMGFSQGGRTAALRFRAENAHRLPDSTKGWYLYHKSKNYNVMFAGVKEGARMGGKMGVWVGGYFWLEAAIDQSRKGRKDFLSSVVAGGSLSSGDGGTDGKDGLAYGAYVWVVAGWVKFAQWAEAGLCGLVVWEKG